MPLRKPHPPIMIGGGGERKTLRLVAQYGDACNLFVTPELPHKLDVLRAHCDEIGRPYEAIEKTVTLRFEGDPRAGIAGVDAAAALERLAQLAEIGIDQAIVVPPEPLQLETLDLFGERIIPEALKLEVAVAARDNDSSAEDRQVATHRWLDLRFPSGEAPPARLGRARRSEARSCSRIRLPTHQEPALLQSA